MENRFAFRCAAILLALGLAAGSFLRVSHMGRTLHVRGPLHYGVHFAAFAVLTFLLAASTRPPRIRALLFLAVLLFGFGTEFYEHLRDGFPVESQDVLADALGAVLGMALASVLAMRRHAVRRVG